MKEIGDEFVNYFQILFTFVKPIFPIKLQGLITKMVTRETNATMMAIPTRKEIFEALSQMGSMKSLGIDRLSMVFFNKNYWGTVGDAIIEEIQSFFTTGKIKNALNLTFLALIPKINDAFRVDHFRPIALCNVAFKLITKIIADVFLI